MILRDYQQSAVDQTIDDLINARSTLGVMATGCGKTVIFAHVIKRMLENRAIRSMVLAHREELIEQACDTIAEVTRIVPDVEKAELRADVSLWRTPIIVSSIQTQISGKGEVRRMHRFDPKRFGLVVIDEAHHAAAASYRAIIKHYQSNPLSKLFGVTATPDRHDEKALGQIFDRVSFNYGICDAIDDGWLVPIEQQFVTIQSLDLSSVRTTAGDLNGADLERVMLEEEPLHGIADWTHRIAEGRKTLIFASSVRHAELLCDILNRHQKEIARYVTGKTPKEDRRNLIADYRAGLFKYLVNVGVATEGFDVPDIEVISIARPTESRSLFSQMIGRGTRPLSGLVDGPDDKDARKCVIANSLKPNVLVLDFVGNSGKHKLISTADILGGEYSDDVVLAARHDVERQDRPANMMEALKGAAAAKEEADRQERYKRRNLRIGVKKASMRSVDPFDLVDLDALREPGWFKDRHPTHAQVELLQKAGIDTGNLTFFQATKVIENVLSRRRKGQCTPKQAKWIGKFGYDTNCSFEEASRLLDRIKKAGWKRPDPLPPPPNNMPPPMLPPRRAVYV